MKDVTYVVYLDEYKSTETYWKNLCVDCNSVIYFDNFGAVHFIDKKYHNKYLQNKSLRFRNVWVLCLGYVDLKSYSRHTILKRMTK